MDIFRWKTSSWEQMDQKKTFQSIHLRRPSLENDAIMKQVQLGLKENWRQFTLLVVINAFVGGMVGMERTILPEIARTDFHIAATTAIFSFIVAFGLSKAFTNYFTGALANRFGRKNLLIAGWIVGLPIPFILMFAGSWNWILFANVLLGINQGLTWSSTVVMKIDLAGEKSRGFAMGLNEFAGYIALAAIAFITGWVASEYGLRPYPFYIGIFLAIAGLLLSWLFVVDTHHHVELEKSISNIPKLNNLFWQTTWAHKSIGSVTQAGLINNMNDGMIWGVLPLLLASRGFKLEQIAVVVAVYPAVWGIAQLFTGKLADIFCKRNLLFTGMLLQGLAILAMVVADSFTLFVLLSAVLGLGTAIVYPTFLAAISDYTSPKQRAESIGIFRFWRDLGYAIGAIITGVVADQFGLAAPIIFIGALTILSSVIIEYRMRCANQDQKIYHPST